MAKTPELNLEKAEQDFESVAQNLSKITLTDVVCIADELSYMNPIDRHPHYIELLTTQLQGPKELLALSRKLLAKFDKNVEALYHQLKKTEATQGGWRHELGFLAEVANEYKVAALAKMYKKYLALDSYKNLTYFMRALKIK